MSSSDFADKLKDTLYWHLYPNKPFIINDEYQIKLIYLDKKRNIAKIEISNIKNEEDSSSE